MIKRRNNLKLLVKRLSCIIRGIGDYGDDAYVSLRAEVKYPGRIKLGEGAVLESGARLTYEDFWGKPELNCKEPPMSTRNPEARHGC